MLYYILLTITKLSTQISLIPYLSVCMSNLCICIIMSWQFVFTQTICSCCSLHVLCVYIINPSSMAVHRPCVHTAAYHSQKRQEMCVCFPAYCWYILAPVFIIHKLSNLNLNARTDSYLNNSGQLININSFTRGKHIIINLRILFAQLIHSSVSEQ